MNQRFAGHGHDPAPKQTDDPEIVAGPRLVQQGSFPDCIEDEVDRIAEGTVNRSHVVVAELLQILPARFQHGYQRLPDLLGVSEAQQENDPAAIFYIALAADEIEPFPLIDEPHDHAC